MTHVKMELQTLSSDRKEKDVTTMKLLVSRRKVQFYRAGQMPWGLLDWLATTLRKCQVH
jgi:hypothetical protein